MYNTFTNSQSHTTSYMQQYLYEWHLLQGSTLHISIQSTGSRVNHYKHRLPAVTSTQIREVMIGARCDDIVAMHPNTQNICHLQGIWRPFPSSLTFCIHLRIILVQDKSLLVHVTVIPTSIKLLMLPSSGSILF